jgi:hypothetical protein
LVTIIEDRVFALDALSLQGLQTFRERKKLPFRTEIFGDSLESGEIDCEIFWLEGLASALTQC